jgi:hypothetical protein
MKNIKKICIIIMLSFSHVYAESCQIYFNKYLISPEIKSISGWKRVVKKNELYEYTDGKVSDFDKFYLGQCLISKGFDIDKHSREIGDKL